MSAEHDEGAPMSLIDSISAQMPANTSWT